MRRCSFLSCPPMSSSHQRLAVNFLRFWLGKYYSWPSWVMPPNVILCWFLPLFGGFLWLSGWLFPHPPVALYKSLQSNFTPGHTCQLICQSHFFSWAIPPGATHPTALPSLNAGQASNPAVSRVLPLLLSWAGAPCLALCLCHSPFVLLIYPLKAKFWYLTSLTSLSYPITLTWKIWLFTKFKHSVIFSGNWKTMAYFHSVPSEAEKSMTYY